MPNHTSITIHEVAVADGMSISTVSRELNEKEDISTDTSKRVWKAIADLG
jgi:DNA-binding LacI/PurR family transcriptional regulator